MNDKMKVLIGYDGSNEANWSLDDLSRAGLPSELDALIVSVGDVMVSPSSSIAEIAGAGITSRRLTAAIVQAQAQASTVLEEARELSAEACGLIKLQFPRWNVRGEVLIGSPAEALIQKARDWRADLIVVGSKGRSALGRFFLGSVSKKVATESHCSVRVARRVAEAGERPVRIMIGIAGSHDAEQVVRAVGRRVWSEDTEVKIIAVDDGASGIGIADILDDTKLIDATNEPAVKVRNMLVWATEELRAIDLKVWVELKQGDPQRVLMDQAVEWRADCIFVGARRANNALRRCLAGSVATGLVTGAACSVELAR